MYMCQSEQAVSPPVGQLSLAGLLFVDCEEISVFLCSVIASFPLFEDLVGVLQNSLSATSPPSFSCLALLLNSLKEKMNKENYGEITLPMQCECRLYFTELPHTPLKYLRIHLLFFLFH